MIVDTTHRPFFRTFTGLADARSATDANTISNHL